MGRRLYQIWPREKTRKFQRRLLAWYGKNRRALPWRSHPTPYRVWISEVMLQQTQVRTVLPYYRRFIRRFPGLRSLAAAPAAEVMAHWAGLGYYSRARSLHRAAQKIVKEHNGIFPGTKDEVLSLPGVGPYIAGAVLSIAFNRPEPVVDGNVRRVVSRLLALEGDAPEAFYWRQAESWIPAGRASDFNQAVMELGALVCTPARPACPECPLSMLCAARARGLQDSLPAPRRTRPNVTVLAVILRIERDKALLLTRRRAADFIPGEWGLPMRLMQAREGPVGAARRLARDLLGHSVPLDPVAVVRHGITYRSIIAHVFRADLSRRAEPAGAAPQARWCRAPEAEALLVSSLFRKALARFSHQVS